jgi:hypothetical protein
MPLKRGKKHMGANYRELTKAGFRGKQRLAILLRAAGVAKPRRRKGKRR